MYTFNTQLIYELNRMAINKIYLQYYIKKFELSQNRMMEKKDRLTIISFKFENYF